MPYLPAQPSETLTPSAPLAYLKMRLRQTIPIELMSDETLLAYLSEAYQDACERARCLPALTSIPVTDAQEYDLPADFAEILLVYRDGVELERIPNRLAMRADAWGYYEYGGKIGLSPAPQTGSSTSAIWLVYARRPAAFVTYDDALEAAFTPEFFDALLHYARWKRYAVDGGAGRISQASWERDRWRIMVARLRQSARAVDAASRSRFVHVLETLHPSRRGLANDVDAR
jgi:hypothetical protein